MTFENRAKFPLAVFLNGMSASISEMKTPISNFEIEPRSPKERYKCLCGLEGLFFYTKRTLGGLLAELKVEIENHEKSVKSGPQYDQQMLIFYNKAFFASTYQEWVDECDPRLEQLTTFIDVIIEAISLSSEMADETIQHNNKETSDECTDITEVKQVSKYFQPRLPSNKLTLRNGKWTIIPDARKYEQQQHKLKHAERQIYEQTKSILYLEKEVNELRKFTQSSKES